VGKGALSRAVPTTYDATRDPIVGPHAGPARFCVRDCRKFNLVPAV